MNRAGRGESAGKLETPAGALKGKPLGTRGAVFYRDLNVEDILAREMEEWPGKMLVTGECIALLYCTVISHSFSLYQPGCSRQSPGRRLA